MSSHTSLSDHCNSIPSRWNVIHSEPLLNIPGCYVDLGIYHTQFSVACFLCPHFWARCLMGLITFSCYFAPGRCEKYCDDWWVCVFVCLLVHSHNSETNPIIQFLCMLPVIMARSCSDGVAIRYALPVLWMTSCSHKGQNHARRSPGGSTSWTSRCLVQFVRVQHQQRSLL